MQKLIKVLHVTAYSAIAVGVILFLLFINNKTPQSIFLFNCIFPVLLLLAIPSFDRPFFRLKIVKRFEIEPRVYLLICSILLSACLIGLTITFKNYILDFPHLVNRNYAQASDASISIVDRQHDRITGLKLSIIANKEKLYVAEDAFAPIKDDETYTIYYLPRTKWVMGIYDENGTSLLKNLR